MKLIAPAAPPLTLLLLSTAWATSGTWGCGSSTVPLRIGTEDEAGVGFSMEGDGAAPGGPVRVAIAPAETTLCRGQCVDLTPHATGGAAPYTYGWDQGTATPAGVLHACPAQTTTYAVRATDSSGHAGELETASRSGAARATVTVTDACTDGGARDADAPESCDSVGSQFAVAGVNPSGPWTFGETVGLGGAFTRFDTFARTHWDADAATGIPEWELGIVNTPSVAFNDQATTQAYVSCSLPAQQFGMCTDPVFDKLPVARWTAAAAGPFHVTATFQGTCSAAEGGATMVDVHILHDGVDAASGAINWNGAGNTTTLNVDVDVAAGDTIDFTFRGAGSASPATTLWTAAVDARVCKRGSSDGG